ncbi:MAG TPA: DEAD/DEAH box helicase family protein [Candidatus Hydrogenedentes bacterium]|nr:DEAD/DEAH box helicase family protein [Candidatus Hydrogenedentota bacterium]HPG66675.1 DEAD/DEAH box helicase family protein [Candidatus Hydrogenedentota bacterium]
MKQVVIENPVLNSPFIEPTRHFKFDNEGITDEVAKGRRVSMYFVPIPRPKKRTKQLTLESEWTKDRAEENKLINQIRERVSIWRQGKYPGVTRTTSQLIEYWTNPEREKKLFFCQLEALETVIYLAEAAKKYGDAWMANELHEANAAANPLLYRIAFKMATGSGKTVVMAMLIAWQALNKIANRQDAKFSDTFLIVTPGITIRDRLRVLLPNDPDNYYRQRDVLPPHLIQELQKAKILITNFHTFGLRETLAVSKTTKQLAAPDDPDRFKETPEQMVRRACREFGNKTNIVVINDEAHHCYRHKPESGEEKLTGDDRVEAAKREQAARVWISGLEAIKAKLGIRCVYDLSATPFFLRGSGYSEGTLFGWVVSDFSLIDAIESGIVKIPRVPVADDSVTGDLPTYRDIWGRIRGELPKKGRGTAAVSGPPKLPKELQGALHSLYNHYEKSYREWETSEARERGQTPPVFIVVCNNTNVSKLVYDYVAGWEKTIQGQTVVQAGALEVFRNDDGHGGWNPRPSTILIDSEQLESGEAMSADFKKIAAIEIDEFKQEYRLRFPDRDVEQLTDEDLLREVMNTVGKPGKLGEHVKCVVSVSMLTEGWDANTVTHILGVRAFGTQLLCEQVIGRGLRRMSYAVNEDGKFEPEYAEVFGVPFSFIPCAGSGTSIPTPRKIYRVKAVEERQSCEITFPRLMGYRYDIPTERLGARFSDESIITLSTQDIATWTESAPIVGEHSIQTLDDLKAQREQYVAFSLAKLTMETYFRDDQGNSRQFLFPQILDITRRWLRQCVRCKDNTFIQLLLLAEFAHNAADRIYQSIVQADTGEKRLMPILKPYDTVGSTRYVDFDTTRPVYQTHPDKCHVNYAVADTDSWEQKMAQALEQMDEVVCYVKNQNLGFEIPYTVDGDERSYVPDFIVRIGDGHGAEDLLNLIIEVSGAARRDKEAKVATAKTLWIPAVNNHGGFGRWDYIEIKDPWNAVAEIREYVSAR